MKSRPTSARLRLTCRFGIHSSSQLGKIDIRHVRDRLAEFLVQIENLEIITRHQSTATSDQTLSDMTTLQYVTLMT